MIFFEIVPLFIMANFFFVVLLLLEQVVELAELIFVRSIPFTMVFETILFYLPSFLIITIPISTLLAVLLAFSRFSADSELVAMHASGAGNTSLIAPVLVFGVIVALVGVYVSTVLLPKGSSLAVGNLNEMLENLSMNDIREKEMYTDIDGVIFYANRKLDNANFEEILLIDTKSNAIISAGKGTIIPNSNRSIIMRFENGRFTKTDSTGASYSNLSFDSMMMNFPLNISVNLLPMNETLMELDELMERFDESNKYIYEYAKRFSMPSASIILALIGLSLGRFLHRSARSIGIIISLIIVFALNGLFIITGNMVNSYNPVLLAWFPVIFIFIIMLPMLYRSFKW